MSEPKNPRLPAGNHNLNNGTHVKAAPILARTAARRLVASNGKDVSGWDAYRNWLTHVQAPDKRRIPLDPNLYTWRGYRNWADQVRREWKRTEK